ncbi:ATP-binding protein [Hydrogenophaga laconesensis]|uniref:histidine kinase n=1 Tax=Hydrogenophaga laconesensis TaxID=1805971 RepID=A0ABU1V815_9BURK|nr:sensor histidine kinase [Hydrogenophaga laconesensis]MDR7093606.1 signal transduction histidine kinase [Hydrogenophaga laconesensis]
MDEQDQRQDEIKVSARVLVQLGEELVTDAEQAILECVKNAYDADSPGCKIVIRTEACGSISHEERASRLLDFREDAENVRVCFSAGGEELKVTDNWQVKNLIRPADLVKRQLRWTGYISIEDAGEGIAAEKLRKSWLTISGSYKRSGEGTQKATTAKGRTPLGDKGVGRLGSMKLGDILEVVTSTGENQKMASAVFRWADCERAETVDQIPVFVETDLPNPDGFKGTRVSVYGLKSASQWANGAAALKLSLATLVSPFEAKAQFPVTVDVDGDKTSLVSVTETLLTRAVADFHFTWQTVPGGEPELLCVARFKERLFRAAVGSSRAQKQKSKEVFDKDGGASFLDWLSDPTRLKRYTVVPKPDTDCFVEVRQKIRWSNIKTGAKNFKAEDPGPFTAAFYYFNLRDISSDESADVSPTDSEADVEAAAGLGIDRATIKRMAGISILRDGFRVRSQGDWLKLAEAMTTGSTYQLRVHNTLGYFALTGEHNYRLVEKSDRESFVENDAYRGFNAIALECRSFANESLEAVRRAMDRYASQAVPVNTPRMSTPEHSFEVVEETVEHAAAAKQGAESIVAALEQGLGLVEQSDGVGAAGVLKDALAKAHTVQRNLDKGAQASSAVRMLRQEFTDSKERMLSLYESAAVGLSARGLAHELRTHIVEIRRRIIGIEELVKEGRADVKSVARHTRSIRAACASITSAAAIIDPLLPRTRTVKETIDLFDFVAQYKANRIGGLEREGINFEIRGEAGKAIAKINRGRLLAVLDNLVRNSVYWLRRGTDVLEIKRPKRIRVDITASGFSVADSGPGIDPNYEDSIFDMFISAKPASERGQGLGLFISAQLLAADGCSIGLSADKNQDGRRYKFTVNLGAVMQGGKR